nr:MAG TPA: hypothetical protein [Caudoviricetes sp.]
MLRLSNRLICVSGSVGSAVNSFPQSLIRPPGVRAG